MCDWRELLSNLLKVYSESKATIREVSIKAKEQNLEWHDIVSSFNERFNPLYALNIENQDDIVLKWVQTPRIVFDYDERLWNSPVRVSKEVLENVLSAWEKRTLYILNILFELEARKKDLSKEHLIILDDIADSFDYSNKYAIIEYLKELSEESNNLFIVILTHNFDFFRTIQYRFFWTNFRDQSHMVNKANDWDLSLLKAEYIRPFENFANQYHQDKKKFIATIPFVRNLSEYSKGITNNTDYDFLTCCLHIKNKTSLIDITQVHWVLNNYLANSNVLNSFFDAGRNIYDFIIDISDEISNSSLVSNWINLENKIILSIAIRLLGEKIMISALETQNPTIRNDVDSHNNQTRYLFDKYKDNFWLADEKWKLLKRVVLISPENIHLNSFMYEPILDMSEVELKSLYCDLKAIA